MKAWPAVVAWVAAAATAPATAPTMAALQGHRRVLVMAAPDAGDARIADQRRILAGWHRQAAERDVALVEVAGEQVGGCADTAAFLRRRYALAPGKFSVVLIGKDGHVALRSAHPVAATTLQAAIDAMPMRRAGER